MFRVFLDLTNFVNEQSVFALICTLVPRVYSSDREKISEHNIVFFLFFVFLLVCLFFLLMAVKKISNTKNSKNQFVFALIHELQKQNGDVSWLQLF